MRKVKIFIALAFFIIASAIGLYWGFEDNAYKRVVINEISANSENEYIELFNNSSFCVSLKNFYLSDDMDKLKELKISEDTVIKPHDSYVINLNNANEKIALSTYGETVFLYYKTADTLIDAVTYPKLEQDEVYSRLEDGDKNWRVKNQKGIIPEAPTFSEKSGFYNEGFELTLTSADEGKIYYTLDGSIPNENSYAYETPINVYDKSREENVFRSVRNVMRDWDWYQPDTTPVDKAFVVRAVVINEAGNSSEVVTNTYFVNLEEYKDKNVISLIADVDDLFGEDGIYVTGKKFDEWSESGRPDTGDYVFANFETNRRINASFNYFDKNGSNFEQTVETRIQGSSTRWSINKRFAIYSQKELSGSDYFEGEIYENEKTHAIVLRDVLIDAVCSELCEGRAVETQNYNTATLFLNGEYWYDCYVTERFTNTYFENKYNINKKNVVICKNGYVDSENEENQQLYDFILDYLYNHYFVSNDELVYFNNYVDMQSYIDYMALNLYLCNMDMSETKNCWLWRSIDTTDKKYEDGKWRWMIYDMDALSFVDPSVYGVDTVAEINSFTGVSGLVATNYVDQTIFNEYLRQDEFKRRFTLSFMDIVNTNFSLDNVQRVLEKYGLDLTYRDSFFINRKQYITQYLKEVLKLEGNLEPLTVSTNNADAGKIVVNTVFADFSNSNEWTGEYFTDYQVILSAVPMTGYDFVGWEGDVESTDQTITVSLREGGSNIHAIFEKK